MIVTGQKVNIRKHGARGSAARSLTESEIGYFRASTGAVVLGHLIELVGDAQVCGDGAQRDAYVAWVPLSAILTVN
jgi:hypothetical protein